MYPGNWIMNEFVSLLFIGTYGEFYLPYTHISD